MKYLALILVLVVSACATSQPEVFKLPTGELVTCQRYAQRDCGMNLMFCGEGDSGSVEFDCLQDVHYVGKVGVMPKKLKPCEGPDGKPTCPPDYVGDQE